MAIDNVEGVKFPNIVRHQNRNYPVVDSNDIRGVYIADVIFPNFSILTISKPRRVKNFILSCTDALYQYISDDVSDTAWSTPSNWRCVQSSNSDGTQYIKIVSSANEISENYGNEEAFVACKETDVIYHYVADGRAYDIYPDKCIKTKFSINDPSNPSRFVDVTLTGGLFDRFLKKDANLSDVSDRVEAINNLTNCLNDAEVGQVLYFDGVTMTFKTLPTMFNIKGRVDDVEELNQLTNVDLGDVYLVGPAGSQDFYEYVCIDIQYDSSSDPIIVWECLGHREDQIWVRDTYGEDSFKILKHGMVDGVDTISIYGRNATVSSSQNITIEPFTDNSSIFASDNIVHKHAEAPSFDYYEIFKNVTTISSSNVDISCFNNSSIIAVSKLKVYNWDGISATSCGTRVWPDKYGCKNNIFAASSSEGYYEIRLTSSDSIYAANTFESNVSISAYRIETSGTPRRMVFLGNRVLGGHLTGSDNVYIGNTLGYISQYSDEIRNNIFLGNYISYNGFTSSEYLLNSFIASSSISSSGFRADRFSSITSVLSSIGIGENLIPCSFVSFINSSLANIGISGEHHMIMNSTGSYFCVSGKNNSVDTCDISGGVFYNIYPATLIKENDTTFIVSGDVTQYEGQLLYINGTYYNIVSVVLDNYSSTVIIDEPIYTEENSITGYFTDYWKPSSFNKIYASKISNAVAMSYSIIGSTNVGSQINTHLASRVTILSSNISGSGNWSNRNNQYETETCTEIFIAASQLSSYTFGMDATPENGLSANMHVKNMTVLSSYFSGVSIYGTRNFSIGSYLYGGTISNSGSGIIGSYLGSLNISGECSMVIGASNGPTANISGSSSIIIGACGGTNTISGGGSMILGINGGTNTISGYGSVILGVTGGTNTINGGSSVITCSTNTNKIESTYSLIAASCDATLYNSFNSSISSSNVNLRNGTNFESSISSCDISLENIGAGSYASFISCTQNVLEYFKVNNYLQGNTLYTTNISALNINVKTIVAETYVGAMCFRGAVYDKSDLPANESAGAVYKVESRVPVFEYGSGSGSDVPYEAGYYPAGTCWVYNGSDWNSLGGVIYYATDEDIDDVITE